MKRFWRMLSVTTVSVAVLAAIVGGWTYQQLSRPTPKLDSVANELVFMSDRDGDWDVYLLDVAGELHNLTNESAAHEYFPGFSFKGEQVHMYSTAAGEITTARVNIDGSDFKTFTVLEAARDILSGSSTDFDPVWNPEGSRMAWYKIVAGIPPGVDIFTAEADGENRLRMTDSVDFEGMHSWSPDGRTLVYVAPADNGYYNTFLVTVADQTVTRLTNHAADDYQPTFAADGERIMVIKPDSMLAGDLEFFVLTADGSDQRVMEPDDLFSGNLTFSPNGGDVAYISNESGYWHIYVMDADDSNVRQITHGESSNLYPSWRPIPASEIAD